MNGERRQGDYRFRGHIRRAPPMTLQRVEINVVSVLCLAMAFGGGFLIGGCLS